MFSDKIVLINGGSKGIGFATAKEFLKSGASVIIASRSKENVKNAVMRLNKNSEKVVGLECDFSKENEVIKIYDLITDKFGGIDILVNSAGISKPGKTEEISFDDWHYIIDNNLTNCFLACKHALKCMKKKKSGKIINVSSIAGRFRSNLAGIHYTCAKAAIIAFTRQLAADVGKYNINVNAICPSQTKTKMLESFLTEEVEKSLNQSIPLGYIAMPEQQAKVITFLASEDANYLTGSIIDVNGGQL